jgi:uncharacterized membrane protein YbhN (UPF0104 family)
LGIFLYLQVRQWGTFDWREFLAQTNGVEVFPLAVAVALIYASYFILIARWQVFLRPLRRSSVASLFSPTVIGFTGLVILGRPGELIRPYLLARSQKVSFASQMAMWFVERTLDLSACALLIAVSLLADPDLSAVPYVGEVRTATSIVVGGFLAAAAVAFLIRRKTPIAAKWIRDICYRLADKFNWTSANEVEAFARELVTVPALLKVTSLSLLLWSFNALACWEVIRAYPEPLHHLGIGAAVVVMGFSILGSVIQLPAVGGGSQLATVAALVHVFHMPKELAVSCGISLWLVTFASVVPVGLILGHRERLSLGRLSRESSDTLHSASVPAAAE